MWFDELFFAISISLYFFIKSINLPKTTNPTIFPLRSEHSGHGGFHRAVNDARAKKDEA